MAEIDVTRIAGNIGAMNSLNALTNINKQLSVHQTRLATGKRINSAADDPAGLTIATKMMARSEGLKVALSNIGDAKNLLAVAESGLGRINDILVQMRNKAEQGASDTLGAEERAAVVTQLTAYSKQIDDIVAQTEWNGNKLINGSYLTTALTFQTGAGASDTTQVNGLANMSASSTTGLSLGFVASSTIATGSISSALGAIASSAPTTQASQAQLSSGTYTVRVTNNATNEFKVELLNAGGNAIAINSSVTGTGATTALSITTATTNQAINFGNGLSVTLDLAGTETNAGAVVDVQVNYVRNGDYAVTSNGTSTGSYLTNASSFNAYMAHVNTKLGSVTEQMSSIGAMTGRLTFKEDQVSAAQINVEAAYNRIMNANMAEEQVNASKFQILQQTATAMLAQANSAPQFLLSLFR